MKAYVVYESLWGNTAAIARAIADGIGQDAEALSTTEATADKIAGADLLVAGAPLLGFTLPTDNMRSQIGSNPTHKDHPPNLDAPSMRDWLEGLPSSEARFATFETRIWWSPGSSAKNIAKTLSAAGYRQASSPERFMVTGTYGPLKNGEIERAKAWGTRLASNAGDDT